MQEIKQRTIPGAKDTTLGLRIGRQRESASRPPQSKRESEVKKRGKRGLSKENYEGGEPHRSGSGAFGRCVCVCVCGKKSLVKAQKSSLFCISQLFHCFLSLSTVCYPITCLCLCTSPRIGPLFSLSLSLVSKAHFARLNQPLKLQG